jgi:hypothetical protein
MREACGSNTDPGLQTLLFCTLPHSIPNKSKNITVDNYCITPAIQYYNPET